MTTLIKERSIIVIIIFLVATTALPFDKVLSFLLLASLLFFYRYPTLLKKVGLVFLTPLLSFFVNIFGQANYKIFFLPIFVACALALHQSKKVNVDEISVALTIHAIVGIMFAMLANIGIANPFCFSLIEKGFTDLYGPMGFSPTQQVYGSLCIINMIICYEKKSFSFPFFISLIGLILTFNRCSLLFCGLLLAIYKRRLALILLLCCIPIVFYFWDTIYDVFFSLSTMESRDELRKGVELSYWKSGDIFVYIFGNGNIETSFRIAQQTEWGRLNVENGIDFLFHTYGILGFVAYSLFSVYFIFTLYVKSVYHLIPIVMFYLFFEQWFTQEFVSSSFLLFLLTMFLLSDKTKKVLLNKYKSHENCIC